MKHFCIHCGQPIEVDPAKATATLACPACGKSQWSFGELVVAPTFTDGGIDLGGGASRCSK